MSKKIDHGSVRRASDGKGGGAITTGSGKGTHDSPHVHVTTSVDKGGNVSRSHTTVTVDGKSHSEG